MPQQISLFGDCVGIRRPDPPKGYVKFKMRGQTSNDIVCPNCSIKGAGIMYYGGGWADPKVQKFAEELEKRNLNGYDFLCQNIDGVMLKCHWSRFGVGEFCCCNAKIWHDMAEKWEFYYLPKRITQEEKQSIKNKIEETRKKNEKYMEKMMEVRKFW